MLSCSCSEGFQTFVAACLRAWWTFDFHQSGAGTSKTGDARPPVRQLHCFSASREACSQGKPRSHSSLCLGTVTCHLLLYSLSLGSAQLSRRSARLSSDSLQMGWRLNFNFIWVCSLSSRLNQSAGSGCCPREGSRIFGSVGASWPNSQLSRSAWLLVPCTSRTAWLPRSQSILTIS